MDVAKKIKARDSIIEAMELIGQKYGEDWKDEFLNDGAMTLDNIRFCGAAYEPIVTIASWESIDRLSSMFAGPLFTSIDHPWPKDSFNKFALPVFQISLADVSILSGEDFGDGVLQCWNFLSGCILREISKDEFIFNKLTPVPSLHGKNVVDGWHMHWLQRGVSRIDGYGEPFFSCAFTDIDVSKNAPSEVWELESHLKTLVRDIRRTQLFGTFGLVQFDHDTIGEKLLVSVSDGANGVTGFGVDGSAQVFYKRRDGGGFEFFLKWSC